MLMIWNQSICMLRKLCTMNHVLLTFPYIFFIFGGTFPYFLNVLIMFQEREHATALETIFFISPKNGCKEK